MSVVPSDKPNISWEVLLKFGGTLVPVSKLLLNVCVVLINSEVGNKVLGRDVEFELCGDKEEAEGKIFVGNVNKKESVPSGETVSDDTVYWDWSPGVVVSTVVTSVVVKV